MRIARPAALAVAMALSACATVPPEDMLGADAVPAVRTEDNGDVITEYRVGTQLRMVKVVPARGATYYIYDRNGDGRIDAHDNSGGPLTYYKLFGW